MLLRCEDAFVLSEECLDETEKEGEGSRGLYLRVVEVINLAPDVLVVLHKVSEGKEFGRPVIEGGVRLVVASHGLP